MEPQEPSGGLAKYIVGIIIIGLVIVGASLTAKKTAPDQSDNAEKETTSAGTETEETASATSTKSSGAVTLPSTVEVNYTDQGFIPAKISVKIGDTVHFINKSSEAMWVGSDEHPTHTEYSGTTLREHCPDTAGTAFDQCGKGNDYSFTFTKAGSWNYHNHSHASMAGATIVTK